MFESEDVLRCVEMPGNALSLLAISVLGLCAGAGIAQRRTAIGEWLALHSTPGWGHAGIIMFRYISLNMRLA